jgi:hypothetical protein
MELLGRQAELAALEAALGDAREGRGRLFLLVGEPGIGKTRLADELCARVGDNARVMWGRCWEAGGAPAYWPWIEVLRPLLIEREPSALAEELGPAAVSVAALVPELRRRLPGLPAEPAESSAQARFLLFDAIARFLRAAAARTPLVIVLDDLHVADRPSLGLLEFVARGLRGTRILLIGTYRDADARLAPDVVAGLAAIEREAQRFPLRRLRADEVERLIAAACRVTPDEQIVAAVVRATEGTPLFVAEVARAMAAEGLPGGGALPLSVLVPEGVHAAIRGQLARVSEETRAVLRVASVAGREFTAALLDGALRATVMGAPGESPGQALDAALDEALDEATRAGLLHNLGATPPRFRFSHILVRETIYRALGAAERERLHGELALILETQGDPTDPTRLAGLSHHFALAGARGDADKALTYCREAGDRALHTYAHEEAASHFRGALATLTGAAPATDRARGDLLLDLADAHQRSGQRDAAREACEQAAECARRLGDAVLLGRVALRLGAELVVSVVDPTLVSLLEESLRGLGEARTALRARLMARLAAARQPAPDPDQPIALATEAIALARELDDRPALAAVLRDARATYLPLDDLDRRLALDLETLSIAYETGDKAVALQALWRLGTERLEEGNFAAASSHLDQYERLASDLRQPHRRWQSMLARASLASFRGAFEDADRLLEETVPLAAASQDPNGEIFTLFVRLSHAWTATRIDEARALVAALEPALAARRTAGNHMMAAMARARVADDESLQRLADALPIAQWAPRFSGQHIAAEIFARARRPAPAEILYDRLLPWASRFAVLGTIEGTYSHYLGLLAVSLGRGQEARRHFEDALARHEKAGARPWVAHTQIAFADLLSTTSDKRDQERATELVADARVIAEALPMPGLLARLGVTRTPVPRHAAITPARLTLARQGESWVLFHEGEPYRFKDSKGMQIVAYLLANPGRELHVLHLAGISAGAEGGDTLFEAPAGATNDPAAREAYRERVLELREDLLEAEANADLGRATRAREELDLLADELAHGIGLGGRGRQTGGSVERARVNIQRRISDALRRIEAACPVAGRRLSRGIHTGAYCSYEE